jgi:hypothetical protein
MPWPGAVNEPELGDVIAEVFGVKRKKRQKLIPPWQNGPSENLDTYDGKMALAEIDRRNSVVTGVNISTFPNGRPATVQDYETHESLGIENSIRRAIARVAAQHLILAPEEIASTIKRRIELGIED